MEKKHTVLSFKYPCKYISKLLNWPFVFNPSPQPHPSTLFDVLVIITIKIVHLGKCIIKFSAHDKNVKRFLWYKTNCVVNPLFYIVVSTKIEQHIFKTGYLNSVKNFIIVFLPYLKNTIIIRFTYLKKKHLSYSISKLFRRLWIHRQLVVVLS